MKQTLKIKRSIDLNGTIVPKGTELSFSTEGVAYFKGKKVEKALIPLVALESNDIHSDVKKLLKSATKFVSASVEEFDEDDDQYFFDIKISFDSGDFVAENVPGPDDLESKEPDNLESAKKFLTNFMKNWFDPIYNDIDVTFK